MPKATNVFCKVILSSNLKNQQLLIFSFFENSIDMTHAIPVLEKNLAAAIHAKAEEGDKPYNKVILSSNLKNQQLLICFSKKLKKL